MLRLYTSLLHEVILTTSTVILFIISTELLFGGKLTKQTQTKLKILPKTQMTNQFLPIQIYRRVEV